MLAPAVARAIHQADADAATAAALVTHYAEPSAAGSLLDTAAEHALRAAAFAWGPAPQQRTGRAAECLRAASAYASAAASHTDNPARAARIVAQYIEEARAEIAALIG